MGIISKFFQHNWFAVLYFNFRMLPFRQAVKLPFDFYHSIRFESLNGKVNITSSCIYRGMIKFGGRGSDMFPRIQTVINIKGMLDVGKSVEFGTGSILIVEKGAKCCLANQVRIGALTKIYCEESIVIGEDVDISWESQIFDTNFHYMEDLTEKSIKRKTSPIWIGSKNWFGNRVNIMKGTVIGDNIIVASNSLCNRDYSSVAPYTILGGSPAKIIKDNVRRLFPMEEEMYKIKVLENNTVCNGGG